MTYLEGASSPAAPAGERFRALLERRPDLVGRPPLQVDLCPELLARNPLAADPPGGPLPPWDLNTPLPDPPDPLDPEDLSDRVRPGDLEPCSQDPHLLSDLESCLQDP